MHTDAVGRGSRPEAWCWSLCAPSFLRLCCARCSASFVALLGCPAEARCSVAEARRALLIERAIESARLHASSTCLSSERGGLMLSHAMLQSCQRIVLIVWAGQHNAKRATHARCCAAPLCWQAQRAQSPLTWVGEGGSPWTAAWVADR